MPRIKPTTVWNSERYDKYLLDVNGDFITDVNGDQITLVSGLDINKIKTIWDRPRVKAFFTWAEAAGLYGDTMPGYTYAEAFTGGIETIWTSERYDKYLLDVNGDFITDVNGSQITLVSGLDINRIKTTWN